jgi:DNA mismatch endonuclease, patch repair protein
MDRLTPEARSRLMSKIRGKNTKPELTVRKYLHARGLRYRLHDSTLPGKPDLVFKSRGAIVLVHGCFWHGHKGCSKARLPKSRVDFWGPKIQANRDRDRRTIRRLRSLGWRVYVIWQCQLSEKRLERLVTQIAGKGT